MLVTWGIEIKLVLAALPSVVDHSFPVEIAPLVPAKKYNVEFLTAIGPTDCMIDEGVPPAVEVTTETTPFCRVRIPYGVGWAELGLAKYTLFL